MAVSNYDKTSLSQAQQDKIASVTQAAQNGTMSWSDAHAAAEAVRNSAGYSGGATGSDAVKVGYTGGSASGSSGYSVNAGDAGKLNANQLSQIDALRQQAQSGLISWAQANQQANAIRAANGYSMDFSGNVSQVTPSYGNFQSFMDGNGYDQYSEETRKAIQAAVDAAITGYNQQIDTTNKDSAELARQAYIAKMTGQKNLDQQMSANGYSGGMADSQRIAMESGYQNNLNDIEMQRLSTIKELQNAIQQAQLSGNQQLAENLSGYLQNLQSQWSSYVTNKQSMDNSDKWNQLNMDNSNKWNQLSMDAQNKETAYARAMDSIQIGVMPSAAVLQQAGMSETEAAAMKNYYAKLIAQNAAKSSGGSAKASASYYSEKPDTEEAGSNYAEIKSVLDEMKKDGSNTEAILSALREVQGNLTSAEFQRLYSAYRGRS